LKRFLNSTTFISPSGPGIFSGPCLPNALISYFLYVYDIDDRLMTFSKREYFPVDKDYGFHLIEHLFLFPYNNIPKIPIADWNWSWISDEVIKMFCCYK
jgi:hypothetical protein